MRGSSLVATLGVLLAGSAAFADGMVTGSGFLARKGGRVPDEVVVPSVIPDQRALISHRDGRETLVIETAFEGRGTDFAWIVPTPSVPRIEEVSPDLFPRLTEATGPVLVSRVPDLGLAGLAIVAGLVVARHGGRRGARAARTIAAGAAALALLTPAGLAPRSGEAGVVTLGTPPAFDVRLPATPEEAPVSVRQREVVGAYDTVTLGARDPRALVEWLATNGYAVPAGMESVAADYVRDGWVFNAMRLRRDGDRTGAVRIHPLAFAFDTAAPVYPMRLTGVGAHPVRVEMFVAGSDRADADGFAVERCALLDGESRHDDGLGRVVVRDDAAKRFLAGAAVLTRLERTFEPEAMKADVPIRWTPFEHAQRMVFSERAATALAWNLGALLAIGAFVGLASASSGAPRRRSVRPARTWIATAAVLLVAADAALAVLVFAPTVETRPVAARSRDADR